MKPDLKPAHHHQRRTYRRLVRGHLQFSRVTVQETDLGIYSDTALADTALADTELAETELAETARELVLEQRGYLEGYMHQHAGFGACLTPLPADDLAPPIVQQMLRAGQAAQVGPMAAVAGAMAQQVGQGLLRRADEVIVENGGDVFIQSGQALTIGLYAGDSPLSLKIGLKLAPRRAPVAVCTSSGTVGHSLSLGRADAVTVVSPSCPLADAAATAIGNRVRRRADIEPAVQWGRRISGVEGILIVMGDKMGMWGRIELTSL